MASNESDTQDVQGYVIVWDETGGVYRIPEPVFQQYRLSDGDRAEVAAHLQAHPVAGIDGGPPPTADDFINPIPQHVLAPYQLSADDLVALAAVDEVRGHEQFIGVFPQWSMGYGPTGIGGKWGVRTLPSYQIVAMNQRNGGNPCPSLH